MDTTLLLASQKKIHRYSGIVSFCCYQVKPTSLLLLFLLVLHAGQCTLCLPHSERLRRRGFDGTSREVKVAKKSLVASSLLLSVNRFASMPSYQSDVVPPASCCTACEIALLPQLEKVSSSSSSRLLAMSPITLQDLPPELLPSILQNLVRRQDLHAVCQVNREWREVGQKLLYRWIRLFGRDLVSLSYSLHSIRAYLYFEQAIASRLFETLASSQSLARLVRRLEVRVYPLSNSVEQRRNKDFAIRMLRNCINVEELVWTRKGSLTDE